MFPEYLAIDPKEIEKQRTSYAEEDLRERSRAVVAVGYDSGVIFVVQNPYAQEGNFYTHPVSKCVGVLGAGSHREFERVRMNFLNQMASGQTLTYGSEGGAREVNARKLAKNYLSPAMAQFFEGQNSRPLRVNWLLADTFWEDDARIHAVGYDGTHAVQQGFSSLGSQKNLETGERHNAIDEFLYDEDNENGWRPDLSLVNALEVSLRAIKHAFDTDSTLGGVPDKQRDQYLSSYREAMCYGHSIEISVLDKNLGKRGKDFWAPVLPHREATTYSESPISEAETVEIIRSVFG